jgi:hypothetical protein
MNVDSCFLLGKKGKDSKEPATEDGEDPPDDED